MKPRPDADGVTYFDAYGQPTTDAKKSVRGTITVDGTLRREWHFLDAEGRHVTALLAAFGAESRPTRRAVLDYDAEGGLQDAILEADDDA